MPQRSILQTMRPSPIWAVRSTRNNLVGRVSFATDAGWLQQAGIPCVVVGPGDIEVAPSPTSSLKSASLTSASGLSAACANA